MILAEVVWATPRKLPKVNTLLGRVAVLDIAFATNTSGASFEKTTLPFIERLGDRLTVWVDHHDHEAHARFLQDPRFVLATKAQHGACPEMITPELVSRFEKVQTICAHNDFDGICSAAKWMCEGREPYPNADADAWAIDTRLGQPSTTGHTIDHALRAHPRDVALRGLVLRFLIEGARDQGLWRMLQEKAAPFARIEISTRELAQGYQVFSNVAVLRVNKTGTVDKTLLLLLGQERAPISLIRDGDTLSLAARFDSGINLLALLHLQGGMPTRVSVSARELEQVLQALDIAEALDILI